MVSRIVRPALVLWAALLLPPAAAVADPGRVSGTMTYGGNVYPLTHVYAWQQPLQDKEIWIYLTNRPFPPDLTLDDDGFEALVRSEKLGGIRITVDALKPRPDDMQGKVYAPEDGGFSIDSFNFGPSWEAIALAGRQITGKAKTKWMNWTLEVEFSAPVAGSTGDIRTIEGAEAQRSPLAEVFVAFEKALLEDGLDAAGPYMTAEKRADMQARLARLGEASFRKFQAERRAATAIGEARRNQVERIDIDGDIAELGARNKPDEIDIVQLRRTPEGWRISEW